MCRTRRTHRATRAPVSASELAKMGLCERKLAFEHRFGEQRSPERQRAAALGDRQHEAWHRDAIAAHPGVQTSLREARCFIASQAFGADAAETAAFRRLRDEVLRRVAAGRWAVWLYYAVAPDIAAAMRDSRAIDRLVKSVLRLALPVVRLALARLGRRRSDG